MQAAMDRLSALLERRRWPVLAVWIVLLVAAAPFAVRQTDHLTSGGFTVPGSQSAAADRGLAQFEHAQSEPLAVVLARKPGATAADVRAAVDRVDRAAPRPPRVALTPRARAAALAHARA